jgi:hypothetical protein
MRVQFPKCGAETHPAFSSAVLQSDGSYILSYPVASWISKAKSAKKAWAEDKIKHLRSWGVNGTIVE